MTSLPEFVLSPVAFEDAIWANSYNSKLYNSSQKEINNGLLKVGQEEANTQDKHAQSNCNILPYLIKNIKPPATDRSEEDHTRYIGFYLNEIIKDDTKYRTNTVSKALIQDSSYTSD